MNEPEHFEMQDAFAVFRPMGHMPLDQAVPLVTNALAFARAQGLRKLLVDTLGVTGFGPPSLVTRYLFIHEWALAAGGMVRVALVVRPEMIDREKFGMMVAANAGLVGNVFASETEATAWLQGDL